LRLFEIRALREIFGIEREEGTEEWRKVHSEELHDSTVQQILLGGMKLGRIRWAEHTARSIRDTGIFWGCRTCRQ